MKPSSTIARLNRLAEETLDTAFATVVYLVVDPAVGQGRVTSAGHPPPVVAYPDGRVELLEDGRGLPLGAGPESVYRQEVFDLPHGTVVLLYTDGLVERRDRSLDDGFEQLTRVVRAAPKDPDGLVERVLQELVGDGERGDDVALLAIRLLAVAPQPLHLRIPADLGSLEIVRDALRIWLDPLPVPDDDKSDVVLATWEACANAVEHADSPSGALVDVFADVVDSSIRVRVQDSGTWAHPIVRSDRGLGLRLMHAVMTAVRVDTNEVGTSVWVEKALAPTDSASDTPS
jgi:anti-sigma regulatory factor (Ser/Thr protein kinase)